MVEQQPDATLKERQSQILEVCGVELSISGVDAWVKRLNLSLKNWQTVTLVQAIDINGPRTAMLLDGPMNSLCFTGFCEWLLTDVLRPGDILVMDNLPSHKSQAARAAITGAGAQILDLPADSPDLNPIEHIFSKWKSLFRSAAARTLDELCNVAGDLIQQITPSDCRNGFPACGYPTSPSRATLLKEML